MKKILIMFVSVLMLVSLYGCKSEITSDDVSKAIADIYSDSEGNVTIALSDGREFNLGNMKGEKGDKGDKGDPGINGINGKDGKDGINGKNGVDGKDGSDGKDGADGVNGRDGSSITDYVQDVTLTDENILTITYGDGTVNELSRVDLEGQYILRAYIDLYDANDNLVDTVLGNYFCYEEGDKVEVFVNYPIQYGEHTYDHFGMSTIPSDITITDGVGASPTYAGFIGTLPGRDIEYHFEAKESYQFNVIGKSQDLKLYENNDYVIAGYYFASINSNYFTDSMGTTYYCNDITSGAISSMPKHDINVTLEYIPYYSVASSTPSNDLYRMIDSATDATIRNNLGYNRPISDYKNEISNWLDSQGFTNYSFEVDSSLNETSELQYSILRIYPANDRRVSLYGKWVRPDAPIVIYFEND